MRFFNRKFYLSNR